MNHSENRHEQETRVRVALALIADRAVQAALAYGEDKDLTVKHIGTARERIEYLTEMVNWLAAEIDIVHPPEQTEEIK